MHHNNPIIIELNESPGVSLAREGFLGCTLIYKAMYRKVHSLIFLKLQGLFTGSITLIKNSLKPSVKSFHSLREFGHRAAETPSEIPEGSPDLRSSGQYTLLTKTSIVLITGEVLHSVVR